jgi:hypothetical protein
VPSKRHLLFFGMGSVVHKPLACQTHSSSQYRRERSANFTHCMQRTHVRPTHALVLASLLPLLSPFSCTAIAASIPMDLRPAADIVHDLLRRCWANNCSMPATISICFHVRSLVTNSASWSAQSAIVTVLERLQGSILQLAQHAISALIALSQ